MNFVDHRFTSSSRLDASSLVPPYSQTHYSRSFGASRTWQEALELVHKFNWEKWEMLKDEAPLRRGQVAQAPGKIPQEILQSVKELVEKLPPLKAKKTK